MNEFNNQGFREYDSNFKEFPEVESEFAAYTDTEFAKPICEISDCGDEFNNDTTMTSNDTKKQAGKRKLLRKISYLVTACVAVIVMGRTLEPVYTYEEDVEDEIVEDTELEEELESEIIEDEPALEEVGKIIPLNYDGWGYSNGNVIPIRNGELWGLMDYEGNVLVQPKYSDFWSSPNDHGYTILGDNEKLYVFDSKGNECLSFSRATCTGLSIGESDIVAATYVNMDNWTVRVSYVYPDGTILYDSGEIEGEVGGAVPFNGEKAYFYIPSDEDLFWVYELTKDGTATRSGGGTVLPNYAPMGVMADGYYVGNQIWMIDIALVQPSTGIYSGNLMIEYVDLQNYKINGAWAYNYGTYGVVGTIYDSEYQVLDEKDYLFDFNKISYNSQTNELSGYTAVYDTIYFDDFQYLAVQDGDDWFYIDYDGNVVSQTYYMATTFNNQGYALVMEESGTAYVINSAFEKVHTLSDVIEVGFNDDTFCVVDVENNKYIYLYTVD